MRIKLLLTEPRIFFELGYGLTDYYGQLLSLAFNLLLRCATVCLLTHSFSLATYLSLTSSLCESRLLWVYTTLSHLRVTSTGRGQSCLLCLISIKCLLFQSFTRLQLLSNFFTHLSLALSPGWSGERRRPLCLLIWDPSMFLFTFTGLWFRAEPSRLHGSHRRRRIRVEGLILIWG